MTLDDLIVSKYSGLIYTWSWWNGGKPSNFTYYSVFAYERYTRSQSGIDQYGWNYLTASISGYTGPTSGGQDCAISVWVAIIDDIPSGPTPYPDDNTDGFGKAGDVCEYWYCIGILGYYSGKMIRTLTISTSELPQEDIQGLLCYSRQYVPITVDPNDMPDHWFDGSATVTLILSL